MYFDWVTWSIWLIGFFILVVWIWIPIKEIRTIVMKKKQEMASANVQPGKEQ